MNSRIKKKISENRGISILLAMFLFLVCAVVGILVLTAGTAAAGRKSAIEEADQRYYGVTSAAEMFRDSLQDQAIEMERTCTVKTEVSYTLTRDEATEYSARTGGPFSSEVSREYTNSLNDLFSDTQPESVRNNLLLIAAGNLVNGFDDEAASYGFNADIERDAEEILELSLTHTSSDVEVAALQTDVTMTLKPNGDIDFVFSKGEDGNRYALKESYKLIFSESVSSDKKQSTPAVTETGTENQFTETFTVTEITKKTGTFRWEYTGSQVVMAQAAP